MTRKDMPITIVHACMRNGAGGSPTAVMDDASLSDDERRRVAASAGTSHAVFVSERVNRHGEPGVFLRFFTAEAELQACGHGTVAALAYLHDRAGGDRYQATVHTLARRFAGWSVRQGSHVHAAFDPGPVDLRDPTTSERTHVLAALGAVDVMSWDIRVAAIGRPRLLVPVATRSALAALTPDLDRLRAVCDRLGFLGCYAYSMPAQGRLAARMFAPSIGVPEDIANANSTACLAAHLAGRGITEIAVDMGDSLGSPATILATTRPGASGPLVELGGAVRPEAVESATRIG